MRRGFRRRRRTPMASRACLWGRREGRQLSAAGGEGPPSGARRCRAGGSARLASALGVSLSPEPAWVLLGAGRPERGVLPSGPWMGPARAEDVWEQLRKAGSAGGGRPRSGGRGRWVPLAALRCSRAVWGSNSALRKVFADAGVSD